MDQYHSGPVRSQDAQQEVSLNVMHLNHPTTIPSTLVRGKAIFHNTGPWCQKGWGLLVYKIERLFSPQSCCED